MKTSNSILSGLKSSFKALPLLLSFIPAIVFLAGVVSLARYDRFTIEILTADVNSTAGLHPFVGILSTAGMLLWAASAAVSALAAKLALNHGNRNHVFFFSASALLSLWLMFDDGFMFHEHLAPYHLGIDEKIIYLALGLSLFVYLIAFWRIILTGPFLFLALSLGLFFTSIVIDLLAEVDFFAQREALQYLLEDSPKWIGIACWFSFHFQSACTYLQECSRPQTKEQS